MRSETHVCPLCGETFFGFGHNPEPLARFEQRCCDICNDIRVIPARLYQAMQGRIDRLKDQP